MPVKQKNNGSHSSDVNNEIIKLSADTSVERAYLLFAFKNIYIMSYAYSLASALVFDNILDMTEQYLKENDLYHESKVTNIAFTMFALNIYIFHNIYEYEQEKRDLLLSNLYKHYTQHAASKQIMETGEKQVSRIELDPSNYFGLLGSLRESLRLNKKAQDVLQYGLRFFAFWGLLNFVFNLLNPEFAPVTLLTVLPSFINRRYYLALLMELYVESGEMLLKMKRSDLFSPSHHATENLQTLQQWSYCKKPWQLKSSFITHFALQLDSIVELTLPKDDTHEEMKFKLAREFYANKLMNFLVNTKFDVLFYDERYMLVKNWHDDELKNLQKNLKHFTTYLHAFGQIVKNRDKKLNQLKTVIKNQHFEGTIDVVPVLLFSSDGLPELKFHITIKPNISDTDSKKVFKLKMKLVALYNEDNVNVTDNSITISGTSCASEQDLKLIQDVAEVDIDHVINQSKENNNQPKKQPANDKKEKKQKPELLKKKFQIIAQNLLNKKNLSPDKIEQELNARAPKKVQYCSLLMPGRDHGTTYAKVNKRILKDELHKQDEKNYANNVTQLKACINKLSSAHVGLNVTATNRFFYHNPTPFEGAKNNNSIESKQMSQAHLMVQHEKVTLYATKIEKFKIKELAKDNNDNNSATEIQNASNKDDEVLCYEFDRLELN